MAVVITRRSLLAAGLGSLAGAAKADAFSFWVFGLLKPAMLRIWGAPGARLHCSSPQGRSILEGGETLRIDGGSTPFAVAGPDDRPVGFMLEIPGVIRRRYFGSLAVTSMDAVLYPVVSMQREVAVGSIVGAELPSRTTPVAALAAQSISARSFLCAAPAPRHSQAQFCDTTHCQFLRAPAARGSVVEHAVGLTRNLVLSDGFSTIPAHYSAACGGSTDSAELDHYRYRSVLCEPCLRDHVARRGHGLGLCQTGAIGLARAGWRWQDIVAKYYPDTVIRNV